MTTPERQVPDDFGKRVDAAVAYSGYGSREAFAEAVDRDGASASTMKGWRKGKRPTALAQPALVARLSEVSGLEESFFWGESEPQALDGRLAVMEATLARIVTFLENEMMDRLAALGSQEGGRDRDKRRTGDR